ncbi:MAG TPA: RNA polymerase sigma-70 factor [Pedobacter sp.]|nr:RNA polymerase sigma-70 factor [Pedobacter sp.]
MAAYSTFTDHELVALLKQGDQRAFEQLYLNYGVKILRKLIRLLKDEEIAKEILQDVFLKVWEKREGLDPEQSFRSYVFRIAENLVIDFFRKAATDKKVMDHLISVSTELYYDNDFVGTEEQNEKLRQVIDILPAQRKKIFVLCKLEGKSYEEVALLLGISAGTVNDHMVKAMKTIRSHFGKDGIALGILVSVVFNQIR